MKTTLSAENIQLKLLKEKTPRKLNPYHLKTTEEETEALFGKADINVKCEIHPSENVERFLTSPLAKKRLFCIQCIIEDHNVLKNMKDDLVPLHEYISLLSDQLEKNEAENDKRIQSMNETIKDFIDEHVNIEETYQGLIETEKADIDIGIDDFTQKIKDVVLEGRDKLKQFFDSQSEIFKQNSEMMLNLINDTYYLKDYPTRSLIFTEVTSCKDTKELEEHLKRYLKVLNPNNPRETLAIFDIIHTNISENLKEPIKFEFDDYTKQKQEEIVNYVKEQMEDILRHNIETFKNKQLKKLNISDFEDFHKSLSDDCLSGFISFQSEKGYKLKHSLDITSANGREFTCVANIQNKFLIYGCKDGCLELYRSSDGKFIKTLQRHQDYVSFVTHFTICKPNNENEMFIVSTGANDRNIYFWDLATGERMFTLEQHQSMVTSIVDTGDGKHLLSASNDGSIIVWNIELQTPVQILHDSDSFTKTKNYFNCITLKMLHNSKTCIRVDLKGLVTIYDINYDNEKEFLQSARILQMYKPISHVFASKIKKNLFMLKTSENKVFVIDAETATIKKSHNVSKSGDVVLLENRNSIFDQEFILINTNSIEECVSNSYLDDVSAIYVKDFLFSGLSSRNRVQLLQEATGDFKVVVLTKNLGSAVYSIV